MANKSDQDRDNLGHVEKIPFEHNTMMFQLPFAMSVSGPSQRFIYYSLLVKIKFY